jgi:hypothetical protein
MRYSYAKYLIDYHSCSLNDQWLDVYKFKLFYLGSQKLLQSWKKFSLWYKYFCNYFQNQLLFNQNKLSIKFWQSLEITDMEKTFMKYI